MAANFNDLCEATLGDIKRKGKSITMLFPTFDDRVKNVQLLGGVRLKDMDDDNWHFEVHSGTKKDVWYDCTLHFKDIQEQLERLVKDRRLWVEDRSRVDLRKLAAAFIEKVNVQVFCSCPAFLYYGSSYILGRPKYDAKYTEPENRPPRHRNPKQYGAVCKHYQNVLKALPFYTGTIAKWLRDVYARDIAGYQKEAMRDFGWLQKAAGALAKRKARIERPRRRPGKRPEEEKPEEKPTDQVQPENPEAAPEERPENERVAEAVSTLPEPQRKMIDAFGEADRLVKNTLWGEEGYYKFWLLVDGTLISVGARQTHHDIVKKSGTQHAFSSGAIRGHIDSGRNELVFSAYNRPTDDQVETLKGLVTQYSVRKTVFDAATEDDETLSHVKSEVKSPDHLEYMIRYGKIEEASVPLNKQAWGKTTDGLSVYLVNGEVVRDTVSIEFTEGGHDLRYDFIPDSEVWIEDMKDPNEHSFILVHELHERSLMQNNGLDYETAHEDANRIEKYVRENPQDTKHVLEILGWKQ